jgi:hypothetical protein
VFQFSARIFKQEFPDVPKTRVNRPVKAIQEQFVGHKIKGKVNAQSLRRGPEKNVVPAFKANFDITLEGFKGQEAGGGGIGVR